MKTQIKHGGSIGYSTDKVGVGCVNVHKAEYHTGVDRYVATLKACPNGRVGVAFGDWLPACKTFPGPISALRYIYRETM